MRVAVAVVSVLARGDRCAQNRLAGDRVEYRHAIDTTVSSAGGWMPPGVKQEGSCRLPSCFIKVQFRWLAFTLLLRCVAHQPSAFLPTGTPASLLRNHQFQLTGHIDFTEACDCSQLQRTSPRFRLYTYLTDDSFQVETVCIHHLVPGGHEVIQELILRVFTRIDLRDCPESGI